MTRPSGLAAMTTRDDGTILVPTTDGEWTDWIAATRLRNWCRDDHLLDWLDRYGREHGFVRDDARPDYDARFDFQRFIFDQSRRFEDAVTAHLAIKVPVTRVTTVDAEVRSLSACEATWAAMFRGDPIIAQGVLRDPEARMYGAPDLLVRSDVLSSLVPDAFRRSPDDRPDLPAPSLEGAPWHYRVVDLKFTTLQFLKGGELSTEHLAYMTQVFVYNRALGRVQGYTPDASYLLGRSWKQGTERGDDCLSRLGRVEHKAESRRAGRFALRAAVDDAAKWVRRVRTDGRQWRVLPVPSVPELWPNMKGTEDAPWSRAKHEIAQELADVTLLAWVTPEARTRAHEADVWRWTDPRASAAIFDVGAKRGAVVDAILEVNRDRVGPAVRPARIEVADASWRESAPLECFVDFETIGDLADDFSALPKRGGQPLIFQIGCGQIENDRWTFRQFTATELSIEGERRVLHDWIAHLESEATKRKMGLGATRVFHWSPAETISFDTAYNSARRRHPQENLPTLGWYDLLARIVMAAPVVVRGAFAFNLKEFARAFAANGLTETRWESGALDGLGAMLGALTRDPKTMLEIARYNETDCRVLAEILTYLRRAH